MLGLTLHVSNEEIARILEQHANSRKGVEYSLVRYVLQAFYVLLGLSTMHGNKILNMCIGNGQLSVAK